MSFIRNLTFVKVNFYNCLRMTSLWINGYSYMNQTKLVDEKFFTCTYVLTYKYYFPGITFQFTKNKKSDSHRL